MSGEPSPPAEYCPDCGRGMDVIDDRPERDPDSDDVVRVDWRYECPDCGIRTSRTWTG